MDTGLSAVLIDGESTILPVKEHVLQSIRDILTTPIGSRVMRPEYGSRLYELADNPVNPKWIADAVQATAEAIDRWEPRVTVKRVKILSASPGKIDLNLTMILNEETFEEKIEVPA